MNVDPASVDLVDLASQLRLAVGRLHRQLRLNDSDELTPTQFTTLVSVEKHGPITLGDLAALEHVAPPSMTAVAGKLEGRGLIERRRDPDDGRVSRAEITAAGRAFLRESRARRTVWLAEELGRLPAAEVRRLAAAVDVLERVGQRSAGVHA